jgi:DNA-binding MarR family transcriptional regulator
MARTLTASDIGSACVCLGVRKAARMVARRYDDAFRALGITSGQFSILAALLRDKPTPLGALADALGMDRTTLNRNLKPLVERGLIEAAAVEKDARVRALQLTSAGRHLLDRAIPLWRMVQADMTKRIDGVAWPTFRAQLQALS